MTNLLQMFQDYQSQPGYNAPDPYGLNALSSNGSLKTFPGLNPEEVRAAYLSASPQDQAKLASMYDMGAPGSMGAVKGSAAYNTNNFIGSAQGLNQANDGTALSNLLKLASIASAFASPFVAPALGLGGDAASQGLSSVKSLVGNAGTDWLGGSGGVGSGAFAGADAAGGVGNLGISANSLIGGATGASGVAGAAPVAAGGAAGTAASSGGFFSGIMDALGLGGAGSAAKGGFSLSNPLSLAGVANGLIGAGSAALAGSRQSAAGNAANNRLQPYQQTGLAANDKIAELSGLGPNGSAGIQDTLENLPGYQFQRGQALQAIHNEGSASGLGSNAMLKSGITANNIAGTNYQNYFNNLKDLTTLGQNTAVTQGNNTIGVGNAQGASFIGGGNALTNGATLATLGPALLQGLGNNNKNSNTNWTQNNG